VSPGERYLSPAETARRLGLSVRALKHYEDRGLLSPAKGKSGWRAYGPDQIGRLHQILTLKTLGLSLSRIATLVLAPDCDLAAVLDMQAAALETQRTRIGAALQLVEAGRRRLAAGEPLRIDDLIELIRETTMTTEPAYQKAYHELLRARLTPDKFEGMHFRRGWQRSRDSLVDEMKTLTARDEAPLSETSLDFMRRWSNFLVLGAGGDEALATKASEASRDAMADPEAALDAPYGQTERRYLRRVGEAVGAEMRRLYAAAEQMAAEGADPGSVAAMALVLRFRQIASVFGGHRSAERQAELRAKGRASAAISERTAKFLAEAGAQADASIEAA